MPSPTLETRTLGDFIAILAEIGVVRRADDLAGAELIIGWESAVVRTRAGWIFRFGRKDQTSFGRELDVLAFVDGRLGVSTPRIEFVNHAHLLMAYRTITGATLDLPHVLGQTASERAPLVQTLANVLASMHTLTELDLLRDLQVPVLDPSPMVEEVLDVRSRLGRRDRMAVDELLAAWESTELSSPNDEPFLLHGDFHFGNMVFTEPDGLLSGIWDFSCVELGDPAADLRYLAGDSTILAAEVGIAYSALTGRVLDVGSARLMAVLEDITDAIAERRPVEEALETWLRSTVH